MASWKTTVAGICALVPQIVASAGGLNPIWANLLTAIAAAIGFLLAKDAGVTGAAK